MKAFSTITTLSVAVLLAAASTVSAANKTWDGGGTGNNWQTGQNWVGDTAPVAGDALFFSGIISKLVLTNDYANGTEFSGITLNGTIAQTLRGNTVKLSGNIENLASVGLTVQLNLNLANNIVIAANNANVAGTVTIDGVIGEDGGSYGITKTGARTLFLNGNNTYSGGTTLAGGTVQVGHDNALGTGNLTFAGGILNANNQDLSLGLLSLTANSTLNLVNDGIGSVLTFTSASRTAGTLTINNWNGSAGTDDRIFIAANPGATFLSNVSFTGFGTGAVWLETGEIVPVPEPTEWALIIFGTLAVFYKFVLPRIRKTVTV